MSWVRWRRLRRAVAGPVALVLAGGLAACGDEPDEDELALPAASPPPVEVSPTPGFTEEEAAAVEEILAAFEGYREAKIDLQSGRLSTIEERAELLGEFSDMPLRGVVGNEINTMNFLGMARQGRPVWDAEVIEIDLDDDPEPTATIHDCLDATEWIVVDGETGEPLDYDELGGAAPRPAPEHHAYVYRVAFKEHVGRWLIHNRGIGEEERC